MYEFDFWYQKNKSALEHLYFKLIEISLNYSVYIFNDKKSFNHFLKMMYDQSSKNIIQENIHTEFF